MGFIYTQGGIRQNKLHAGKNLLKWRRQTVLKVKADLVDLTVTTTRERQEIYV